MMRIEKQKIIKYGLIFIMLLLMTGLSELLKEPELIFPEIAALVIGAWLAPKQPWKTTRFKMFFLMTLSAIVGVIIVRYIPLPLAGQIGIAFLFTAVSLTITKTSMVPMISACILPILLRTDTFLYPISVSTMTGIIVIVQWILNKLKIHNPEIETKNKINLKKEIIHWGILLLTLIAVSIVPVKIGQLYFIAPPLIVIFVEFSNPQTKLRQSFIKIWLILIAAATAGVVSRTFLHEYLHLPLSICLIPAVGILFFLFEKTHILFPPIGAIALLPLILNPETLYLYPIEVGIGGIVFMLLAQILFPSTIPLKLPAKNTTERTSF